jgi:23S rRNA (adenine2503-C2)-methyltransferase
MRREIKIPTGYLIVDDYANGALETLSIGDYGKAVNVKADFLGYTRPIDGVPNGDCLPMSEKWVITLSTQYGCPMRCNFCDVPNIKFGGNATFADLKRQLYTAIGMFPDVRYAERLNIHFARMGEPTFNERVFKFSEWLAFDGKLEIQRDLNLRIEVIHPVLTTSLPKSLKLLKPRILAWCDIKNNYFRGQAGLQFSINSTDEDQRNEMFNGMQMQLEEFSKFAAELPEPIGRKYCLNFAYATGSIIDAKKLVSLFDPNKFMVKITPIHNNEACKKNGIETVDGYQSYAPYADVERSLIDVGFDVLVFVPSMDEEDGLVTCGNAVLGGSKSEMIPG